MAVIGGSAEALELGAGLRKLRNGRGMSTRQLGERIGVTSGNFTHWENGDRLIREDHLLNILDVLEPDDDERERLLGLHQRASGPGQLVPGATSIGAQLAELIKYEQAARKITTVAPLVIPGLLQTADMARATFIGMDDVDTRVTLRVGRRDIVTRDEQPVELVAYIDTEALLRPVAQPAHLMSAQLRHLLKMGELPNVAIRLVSSMQPGYNPMLAGPFHLIESARSVVHVEHYQTSAFLWRDADVRGFQSAVDMIDKIAMTPARSAEVIAEIVNGMEST